MTASTTQAKGKAPRRAAAKPKRSGAQKRENRTGWAFMAPFAVLFAFVFILPIIWAIYWMSRRWRACASRWSLPTAPCFAS